MHLSEERRTKTPAELEQWFLDSLEADPVPLAAMLAVLQSFADSGNRGKALDWGAMLQDALAERDDTDGMLKLLRRRCRWSEDSADLRASSFKAAGTVLKDRMGHTKLKAAGFDRELPTAECLRRLGVLIGLDEGVFCLDKTWGFGVVSRLDDFYEKVTIDFHRRPGHQMSFAYAAESLQLIDDDHLYARRHTHPEALAELVKSSPDEVSRIAVRSFGPLSAPELQEFLVPDFVAEADWKAFWDGARKGLKADPLVDLPTKRNAPIRLLESEKAYDDSWFRALAEEKDPVVLLERARELDSEGVVGELGASARAILVERLAFAVHGSEGSYPELTVRLLLAIARLDLGQDAGEEIPRVVSARDGLLKPDTFLSAACALPIRDLQDILRHLDLHAEEALAAMLVSSLVQMPVHVLEPVLDHLAGSPHQDAASEQLREALLGRAQITLLAWAAKSLERVREWSLTDMNNLLIQIVDALAVPAAGFALKARKQLLAMISSPAWLKDILGDLSDRQRQTIFSKIKLVRGWEEAERRSLMARLIKLYPELQASVSDRPETGPAKALRLTSWRSYRERHEALRKLMEETIPANSKEIGVARSYGDLRENFEYQAAKDMQRLLLKREADLEADLSTVKGSDFSLMPSSVVGMGTCVSFERAGGTVDRYCILGEWDRDEALGIISSQSKLAEALAGHGPGDEVTIPGEHGDETCKILEVSGLSDEVRQWVAGG